MSFPKAAVISPQLDQKPGDSNSTTARPVRCSNVYGRRRVATRPREGTERGDDSELGSAVVSGGAGGAMTDTKVDTMTMVRL